MHRPKQRHALIVASRFLAQHFPTKVVVAEEPHTTTGTIQLYLGNYEGPKTGSIVHVPLYEIRHAPLRRLIICRR